VTGVRAWIPKNRPVRAALPAALAFVLLFAGDRVAAGLAGEIAADRFACAAGAGTAPSVSFGGALFLPQLIGGRFTEVNASAQGVHRGAVTLDTVDARLRGVTLPDRKGVHADHVTVAVTVGYASLPAEVAGRQVSYHSAGDLLAVDTAVDLAGRSVPVTVLLAPAISQNAITLTLREVEVLGLRAPAETLRGTGIGDGLNRPLPALPDGLTYQSVTTTDHGLRITAAGDDITLATTSTGTCRRPT
jgi:LmeA-like phospholipid-binding